MKIDDVKAQAEAGLSISPGTQKSKVLRVLVTHPQMAFEPKEIAEHAGIPVKNAPTVCKRLADMGAAANKNGYYYLPQDETIAAAARHALGSAHQQDLAQKTAAADEAALTDKSVDEEPESMSEAEVEAELEEISDELPDL